MDTPFTEVPPLWMAGNHGCVLWGKPNVGLVAVKARPCGRALLRFELNTHTD
jgi:hypothetical protein